MTVWQGDERARHSLGRAGGEGKGKGGSVLHKDVMMYSDSGLLTASPVKYLLPAHFFLSPSLVASPPLISLETN